MSQPIISVENLSKSYLIGHQSPQDKYTSLRDTISHHARNFTRRTMDTFCGKQMLAGDSVEEFWALKDVSFEVQQGEVLGIIGRNGAGKSTLLKVLSRITEPTTGRVTLRGRVASLLEVGTGFHPELSGRENIFLNGAILGMSRREINAKFDEIVDFAGVEKFLDTPVKRYSSGMYVRLAFAVAAHLEPEILVVDEVLAVGDAEFQKKCMGKMKDVAGGGRTVLFVSHNMSAVRNICNLAILMNNGKIECTGNTNDVLTKYSNSSRSSPEQTWLRKQAPNTDKVACFDKISVKLLKNENNYILEVKVEIIHFLKTRYFIAVDILDSQDVPLMQAIPFDTPDEGLPESKNLYSIHVFLPGLIPDDYNVSVWMGSHFDTTLDNIVGALRFSIGEGPFENRSFPYSRDHGFMVPKSVLAEKLNIKLSHE